VDPVQGIEQAVVLPCLWIPRREQLHAPVLLHEDLRQGHRGTRHVARQPLQGLGLLRGNRFSGMDREARVLPGKQPLVEGVRQTLGAAEAIKHQAPEPPLDGGLFEGAQSSRAEWGPTSCGT